MKDSIEQHSFKLSIGIAMVVIIFLITITAQFASWKSEQSAIHNELDARVTHVGEKVIDIRAEIETLKLQATARDIQLAQINTKLANIETLLIEIKQDIKEKR